MSTASDAQSRKGTAAARGEPPRVCVTDTDRTARELIRGVLTSANIDVSTFESAEDFLDSEGPASAPDCVVSELVLPGLDGAQLQALTMGWAYAPTFIFVSETPAISMVVQVVKAGAADVLVKPLDPVHLLRRVRECLAIANGRRADAQHRAAARSRLAGLSLREQDVLTQLLDGRSTKQIAAALGLSVKTIEAHRGQLMRKTGALHLADLFRLVFASLDTRGQ